MNEKMERVIEKLEEKGIEADVTYTPKNNETVSGISISSVNGTELKVRPVIYVTDWETEEEDEIVDRVVKVMNDPECSGFNADGIINMISAYDTAAENIVPTIVQTAGNEALLGDLVTREIPNTDLSVYFRVVDPTDHCASVKISKAMLENWNVSEDEVYEKAVSNIDSIMDPLFCTMSNVIGNMIGKNPEFDMMDDIDDLFSMDEKMFIIYSKKMGNGSAAAILKKSLMEEIYSKYGHYYILPSSLHEVIIVPSEKDESVESDLVSMVRQVNATEVAVQDKLSDSLYEWEPEMGLLKVA